MADHRDELERMRDTFNARDADGFAAAWNEACEWHPFLTARVEGDPGYHGHNGIRAWFEDTDEMFSEVQVELGDFSEVGDRLLVLGHMRAISRTSGAEVSSEVGWIIEPGGDRFQRGWAYTSHEDAAREVEAATPARPAG